MERAGPGDPPREDLAPFGDEALEELDVLPVDVLELLRAELADLAPPDEKLLARAALAVASRRAAASGRASGSATHSHDSLLSAATGSVVAGSAGGAGGRGG